MFLFRRLTAADAHFARQADAPTYRALLREMRAADAYAFLPYIVLQKKAGRMWSALKKYRAEQRAVRTHLVKEKTYMQRIAAEPIPATNRAPQANSSAAHSAAHLGRGEGNASFPWPAAHAGCIMQ